MRVEGGNVVAFDECESMNNGEKVSLCLKVILRDVDGNDRMTFVGGDDFDISGFQMSGHSIENIDLNGRISGQNAVWC